MMVAAALRDLQWRLRRFLVAALGTSLVFAMTLVLTGLSNGFDVEARDTVSGFDADAWVVRDGAAGPFLGAAPFALSDAAGVADLPGVEAASPFVFGRRSISDGGSLVEVNVFGAEPGGPGMPRPGSGEQPAARGEVLVSTALGRDIGDTVTLAGRDLTVVGTVSDSTAIGGVANVFLGVLDAQEVAFSGAPIASALALRGAPDAVPAGFQLMDDAAALDDMLRPLEEPRSSITLMSVLLWLVAALIIGAVVYLSALERTRDFAVFKAMGLRTSAILGGLALQAAILALLAALVGSVIGVFLAPVFPMRVEVPTSAFLLLPAIAVGVGVVASALGMRRVASVDPALAFGGP